MINIAKEACLTSGKILLDNLGKLSSSDIETKSKNNFVNYVDKLSEEIHTIDFENGENTKIKYTKAKIIDMYGFSSGMQ